MTIPSQPHPSTTTQLRAKDDFSIAACRLKRAAPNSWKDFEVAFAALCEEQIKACVLAARDDVFNKQGRAQFASELRDLYRDCIATADKIEAKLKGKT